MLRQFGLFAGSAENVDLDNNVYLGESNMVDGQVYKELIGVQQNVNNTNWSIRDNSVEMVLTEEDGTVVYADKLFVSVDKKSDTGSDENVVKVLVKEFDLAHFATALRGTQISTEKNYHCVITAHLNTGDAIVVKDFTF